MKWSIGLEGRCWSREEAGERRSIFAALTEDTASKDEPWPDLSRLVLERLGIREVMRLADPNLWRQALAESNALALPPANLPLPIWDAYQAVPYPGFTLHLSDGAFLWRQERARMVLGPRPAGG